jgi:hypothetical protein
VAREPAPSVAFIAFVAFGVATVDDINSAIETQKLSSDCTTRNVITAARDQQPFEGNGRRASDKQHPDDDISVMGQTGYECCANRSKSSKTNTDVARYEANFTTSGAHLRNPLPTALKPPVADFASKIVNSNSDRNPV